MDFEAAFCTSTGSTRRNNHANRFTSKRIVFGRAAWEEIFDSLRRLGSTTTSGVFNPRREPTLFDFQQRLGFAGSR
jgi:hypothetical protein